MTSSPRAGSPEPDGAAIAWRIVRSAGSADDFHHEEPDPGDGHQLWIHTTPGPALVLGSTQPEELIRRHRAGADGIEVCRRRSGGGLVYLDPATDCWLDAIVPADSPLWDVDVGRAFHWIGRRWATVLDPVVGPDGPAVVNRPGPRSTAVARPLWCFSGLGHGEVTVGASKVVGLSQRRTREWVRLQSLVLGHWPGRRLLPYLDLEVARELPGARTDPASHDPSTVRAGPPPGVRLPDPRSLAETFIERNTGETLL